MKYRKQTRWVLTAIAVLAAAGAWAAPLEVARVFADHMVLQRNAAVPVFGVDTPGQQVTVQFDGQTKVSTADINGDWRVDLDPMMASMTGRTLMVTGSSVVSFSDVLVGVLWLAAGQSNMRWTVAQSSNTPHPANYGRIRMANWEGVVGASSGQVYGPADFANLTPENFYTGTWEALGAGNVGAQSAVAYFFANALARELAGTGPGGSDIPVGVVELAYGGTSTEAFIPPADLLADPYLKAALEDPRGVRTLGQWITGRVSQNLTGYTHSDPAKPHPHPFAPGFLYHVGMTHIAPFAFKGAIWYQGESNAEFTSAPYKWNGDRLSDYQADVMTVLVDSWRAAFERPDLPFYMVQLPRIDASNRVQWPWYREAQSRAARSRDGVELAVVTEFGIDGSNVHPPNKEPVGERLAYIARGKLYGESIPISGPVFISQDIVGDTIILHFDHVEDGLISQDGAPLRHFEIAGADRTFVAATAVIVSNTVEVSAASVPAPVAVRYGWDMNLDVNFYNTNSVENLPASPFRTDDWVAAPGRVIRVACIGDSITFGSTIPDPSADGYPAQLQRILGTQNFEVRNFGKSGAGVHRPANKYDSSSQHAAALAYQPDIVICNLGINDITHWGTYTQSDFVGEYRDLVDAYAGLATQPLFIHWHELSPLFPGQNFYGDPNLITLNQWIADSAAVTGARTIDMYDFFASHPEWYPDNIHPNAEGARHIAEQTFRYLAGLDPLHGKPRVTEFMAHNTTTLQDEDGDYSDWIEVTNLGRTGMVLGGYHLTDNPGDAMVWQLPPGMILETNQAVMIFASGKNRVDPETELHTGFTLNEDGGYLALAGPTGEVLHSFSPLFPPQFPDIAYGVSPGATYSLIDTASTLRAEVPVDGTAGLGWTAPGFDDTAWTSGVAGVGYEELAAAPPGSKASTEFPVRFDGNEIWNAGFLNGWTEDPGAAKSLDGTVLGYDHSGSGAADWLEGTASTVNGGATTWDTGNHGDWTLEVRLRFNANSNGFIIWAGTDSRRILVELHGDRTQDLGANTFQVNHDNLDGNFHNFRVAHDASAGRYHVWRDGEELTPPGGVTYDATAAESRLIFGDYTSGSFGDGFDVDIASVRYDQTGVYPPAPEPIYTNLVSLDMAGDMTNQNASCYVRVPFDLSEPLPADSALSMDVQYDDGFIAYLNGMEVARRNASGGVSWNSVADTNRDDYDALAAEALDLSAYLDSLVAGSNVLAIHALNHATDAERFLISAQLTATTPPVTGFQTSPTPGTVNGPTTTNREAWHSTHFDPTELTQPEVSGEGADPDGDRITNLFEYVYRTNPRVFDADDPLWMRLEPYANGGETEWLLTASFPWRLGLADAAHEVQVTGDLPAAWNEGPGPHTALVSDSGNNGDGTQTLTYRDAGGSAALQRFMRLRVMRL